MTSDMTDDESFPEDEAELTAEQMDALMAAGEIVELVEMVTVPQGVNIVTTTDNFGGAVSQIPVTISGPLMSFTLAKTDDDDLARSA